MEKADIWRFLLFVLFLLAFHYAFLWRQLNVDQLRMRLLALHWNVAKLIHAHSESPSRSRLIQLQSLIHRLTESGQDLIFARIVFARLFLSPDHLQHSCRQVLEAIEDETLRQESVELLCQVEDAVALRLVLGSPVLWVHCLYQWVREESGLGSGSESAKLRLSRYVPGFNLLESTLFEKSV